MGVLQQATGSMGGSASGAGGSEATGGYPTDSAAMEMQSGAGAPFRRGGPMVEVLPAGKLTPQGLEYARQRGIYRGDDLSW